MRIRNRKLGISLAVCGALVVAACGNDDTETGVAGDTATTGGEDLVETVEVVATDYAFEIPDTIQAGATITFRNEGQEVHELVVFLIPEDEERSVEELLALDDEELGEVFGGEPEPALVMFAGPGEAGTSPPDFAATTLDEPGRYGAVCFVPEGTTEMPDMSEGPPEEGEDGEGEEEGPPPGMGDGPPHFEHGMFAEFTVE